MCTGYVLRVQSGQAPAGVHIDKKDYKQWRSPVFKSSTASFEKSSVDRRQSGPIYPTQDDRTTNSQSSKSHYLYPVLPEMQNSNVPNSQAIAFKSGLNLDKVRGTVVYTPENKADTYPDGKKVHQGSSDAVFPIGPNRFQPRNYHARTLTDFSPFQEDKAVGFRPNNRKTSHAYSGTARPYIQPNRSHFSRSNTHPLHPKASSLPVRRVVSTHHSADVIPNKLLKPFDKTTGSSMMGSDSARKVDPQISFLAWSPRVYTSNVMPEARGYAHVHHLRPGSNKAQVHGSSSPDPTKLGFASNEKQLNVNYYSKEGEYGSWRPTPDRAPITVQGKFKPFERLSINDDLHSHAPSSDNETAPNQTFALTTLPPSLNSTGVNSTAGPSVTGELSTESASPMEMEGQDAELLPRAPNPEEQSESSVQTGLSLDEHQSLPLQSADEER